jgi:O-antigen biosynthesis protein
MTCRSGWFAPAIYPEVAPGNLLGAKRVVRYVMNVPGKLGRGRRQYDANEFLVAYNKHLAPYADGRVLQVPSVEPWFHDPGPAVLRDVDAFYVGKGLNSGKHPEHCVEITRNWPPSRREVAALLRRCRTLYTYDNFTMMVPEAQLCGCETLLVHPDGSCTPVVTERLTSAEEFRHQLHAFIVETQRL